MMLAPSKSKIIALADEFAGSPRYAKILSIFEGVDALEHENRPLQHDSALWGVMNRIANDCTGNERYRIQDLFRQALAMKGRGKRR